MLITCWLQASEKLNFQGKQRKRKISGEQRADFSGLLPLSLPLLLLFLFRLLPCLSLPLFSSTKKLTKEGWLLLTTCVSLPQRGLPWCHLRVSLYKCSAQFDAQNTAGTSQTCKAMSLTPAHAAMPFSGNLTGIFLCRASEASLTERCRQSLISSRNNMDIKPIPHLQDSDC